MAADDPSKHFFKFIPPAFLFNLLSPINIPFPSIHVSYQCNYCNIHIVFYYNLQSIPKSFLAKLNEWRCKKKAILRRGSHKWAVDINSDGEVFGDGWRKFVRDNGVQELDFIVFKHLGNMVFDFHVFDQSTCERQYYYPEDVLDVDIDVKDQYVTESSADSLHTDRHKLLKMVNCKATKKTKNYWSESKDGDSCTFVTIMSPYCIKEARLHVPMQFARSNRLFINRGHKQTFIVDEAQRTWPATLRIESSGKIKLTGWRKLISKNRLKVGDACKFELVKSGEMTIFNFYNLEKKPVNNHRHVKNESGLTNKKTSSTRYFISTLNKKYMYLPKEFATKNGLFYKEQMILKNIDECSWVMDITNYKNRYCCIKQGWKAFCAANRLKEGVRFTLDLISNGEKPVAYLYSLNNSS